VPLETKSLPNAAQAATPKAIEEGSTTKRAAKPPHKSPVIGLEILAGLSATYFPRKNNF
jgi:hypothetical protein